MKSVIIGILCALSLSFQAQAKSKKSAKLFLNYNELLELNLEDRVNYLDNALDYVVLTEVISEKIKKEGSAKKGKKNAYLNSINSYLDLLPSAWAQGITCICATYAGMKSNEGDSCRPLVVSANNRPECGSAFTCNPNVFFIPTGGSTKPICVPNSGNCGSKSQACLTEFRRQRSSGGMTTNQFNAWAQAASGGLGSLNRTTLGAESVEARCATRPNDSDCRALAELKSDIESANVRVLSTQEFNSARQAELDARRGNASVGNPKGFGPDVGATPASYPSPSAGVLGPLECIASGLTAADPSTAGQVNEYIALMGVAAQTYDGGPFRSDTEDGRRRLLENVIERVSSYGYCTDSEFRSGALSNASSQSQIRDVIDGREAMTSGFLFFRWTNSNKSASILANFGITDDRAPMHPRTRAHTYTPQRSTCGFWARLFGRCSQANPDYTTAYSNQVFQHPRSIDGTPVGQQMHFRAQSQGHQVNFPNTPFASCTRAIQARGQKNPAFRMCEPKGKSGFSLNKKGVEANSNLANQLYQACGLAPKKRIIPRTCPEKCHDSYAFGRRSSWLKGCTPPREGEGGKDGPGPGPGPGGKGGEGGGGPGPGSGPGPGDGAEGGGGSGPGSGPSGGPGAGAGAEGGSSSGGPGTGVR